MGCLVVVYFIVVSADGPRGEYGASEGAAILHGEPGGIAVEAAVHGQVGRAAVGGDMVVRATVHYCAFGHFYHKPAHLWTDMRRWAPRGTTGTGLRGGKCGMVF